MRWFDLDHGCLEEIFSTLEPDFCTKSFKMNTEVQDMETCQIFVVPMGNTKITEELYFQAPKDSVTSSNNMEKSRDNLDDKETHKDSLAPSDKIEKEREDFVAPSAETDKRTKVSTNTQKATNISTLISQL